MCITIQIRGKQATDAGLPQTSARNAALAFAWISFTCVALTCFVLMADLFVQRKVQPIALKTALVDFKTPSDRSSPPASEDIALAKAV